MTDPLAALGTEALIEHILERFHEGHRRDLPPLQGQAQAAVAAGAPPALGQALDAMAQALEQHQFKEEMRLFPMMQQGGNSLIGHLLDDLEAEHRQHEQAMAALHHQLQAWPDTGPEAQALRQGLARLFAELAEHVRVEDDLLFPRFSQGGRRKT